MTCRRWDCPVHRDRVLQSRMRDYWALAHINWASNLLHNKEKS